MSERLLTFRSGGWVLLLSGILCVFSILYVTRQPAHEGDGEHPETYGFDLSRTLVAREEIVASGFGKDVVQAMTDPGMMPMAEAVKAMESEHSTLLKPGDRVIGVVVDGDARAYPTAVLAAHEIVNDIIGGVPVAVTYNPLCDSAVVLERRIDDTTLTFGVSGLLYNSCLLMYDRQSDPKNESLWSPLGFKAIAGPMAARMLKVIPCELVTWRDWSQRHADSKVVKPQAAESPDYSHYLADDALDFPVAPVWDTTILPNKTPVVAIRADKQWRVFVPSRLAKLDPAAREAVLKSVPGVRLVFDPAGEILRAESALPDFAVAYVFIFAWHAQHPTETTLVP